MNLCLPLDIFELMHITISSEDLSLDELFPSFNSFESMPSILTLKEKTIGTQNDMDEYFTYNITNCFTKIKSDFF